MFSSITHLEKLLFTRELSVLLRSGVPLGETLESLRDKTRYGALRNVIEALLADVENGQSLAHALERFPKVFDPLYVNLVKLGETSGTLRENLDFLTRQIEGAYALRKKIQGIALYPTIVLSMALILGALISLFILPRLIRLFDSFDVVLPLSTRILLWLAAFMQTYGVVLFLAIFGVLIIGRFIVALPAIKPYWHRASLSAPVVGGLLRDIAIAHFCRDMGIMLQSGLPILEALSVEEKVMSNRAVARLVAKLSQAVATGKTLSDELAHKRYAIISPLVIKMIAAGERTGKLGETFIYLENFFEAEADRKIKSLTVLFEPVLLLVVGAIVVFLALAILTPIYSLTGSVRR
jgi:type IV pilus assembly protein PilC